LPAAKRSRYPVTIRCAAGLGCSDSLSISSGPSSSRKWSPSISRPNACTSGLTLSWIATSTSSVKSSAESRSRKNRKAHALVSSHGESSTRIAPAISPFTFATFASSSRQPISRTARVSWSQSRARSSTSKAPPRSRSSTSLAPSSCA
jgi:hypothetical protein